jgi:pimeloyl-ACP methyl ester carboxylesterase
MSRDLPKDLFTSVNGIRTRYWTAGENGSTVVLIHGLSSFIESWMYNIVPLAERHRVYAMDLLGFGQTDKTPLVHDMKDLVRFIHGFMETLHLASASLIGNSLGGGLALQFILDYPEKVEKLVLVDNAEMGREICTDFKACALPLLNGLYTRKSNNGLPRLMKPLIHNPLVISEEFYKVSRKYNTADGAVKALLSALTAGINFFGQKSKITRPLLEKLPVVKAPTLVIWGKQDQIIPVSHAQIAASRIPGARLEIFENCGHMPQFEQPDKFNKLVLGFLEEKQAV